jgi:hypothetical protein
MESAGCDWAVEGMIALTLLLCGQMAQTVGLVSLVSNQALDRTSMMSWVWPAESSRARGFPSASVKAWIFVVRPSRERPIA